MAKITGILCQVITGNVDGAGTDGSVFLGIGGREFRLDSTADDYERKSWREYIMGRGPVEPNLPPPQIRVRNADKNDPRVGFPLDTINLPPRAPVYLRFEPVNGDDNWNLSFAAALVYQGEGQFVAAFMPPVDFDNLWMGQGMGKVLYLTNEFWLEPQGVLEIGRRIAARASSEKPGA
jgi:hypothetical protein